MYALDLQRVSMANWRYRQAAPNSISAQPSGGEEHQQRGEHRCWRRAYTVTLAASTAKAYVSMFSGAYRAGANQ